LVPRAEVIDELWSVTRQGQPVRHDGPWSRATLEVCLAILASQAQQADVWLSHQVAVRA
jgi:phthalate 4,5-cis-dihydrodiol dehydrogenase